MKVYQNSNVIHHIQNDTNYGWDSWVIYFTIYNHQVHSECLQSHGALMTGHRAATKDSEIEM